MSCGSCSVQYGEDAVWCSEVFESPKRGNECSQGLGLLIQGVLVVKASRTINIVASLAAISVTAWAGVDDW